MQQIFFVIILKLIFVVVSTFPKTDSSFNQIREDFALSLSAFREFKIKFQKDYEGNKNEKRFDNFFQNFQEILHQKIEKIFNFSISLNIFSDLSFEDFSDSYLMKYDVLNEFQNFKNSNPAKIKFITSKIKENKKKRKEIRKINKKRRLKLRNRNLQYLDGFRSNSKTLLSSEYQKNNNNYYHSSSDLDDDRKNELSIKNTNSIEDSDNQYAYNLNNNYIDKKYQNYSSVNSLNKKNPDPFIQNKTQNPIEDSFPTYQKNTQILTDYNNYFPSSFPNNSNNISSDPIHSYYSTDQNQNKNDNEKEKDNKYDDKKNKEKIKNYNKDQFQTEQQTIQRKKEEKKIIEKENPEKDNSKKDKFEREKLEREKLEREKIEREKLEKAKLEKEKLEKEKLEKEKLEKEKLEKEKLENEKREKDKLEKAKLEKEKLEKEKLEKEKLEKEKLEKEKLEKEKLEKEKREKDTQEKEKREKEKRETDKQEKDKQEKDKQEKEKQEKKKQEKEKQEKEKTLNNLENIRKEKLEKEKIEKEILRKIENIEKEKLDKEKIEKIEKEKLVKIEKEILEKIEKEKLEKEKLKEVKNDITNKENKNKIKELDTKKIENPYILKPSKKRKIDQTLLKYPLRLNWQHHISKVKNQAKCAACYAFSAISSIELLIMKNKNLNLLLSEQEIIDCDLSNLGCIGGTPFNVYDYINNQHGISYSNNYNYIGKKNNICLKKFYPRYFPKIEYYFVRNPVELIVALNEGPVSIIHHVNENLKKYSSGVFDDNSCNGKLNHSSLAVGYDLTGDEPFIICKNAWGDKWGMKGYYNLALGDVIKSGKGFCNLFDHDSNVVPVLLED